MPPGTKSNCGRGDESSNAEQGSGEAAIEEGGVDPVEEPEGLNQQTAETQPEGSNSETAQDPVNASRGRLRGGAGEPPRNPDKSEALRQTADRNPRPAGLQWVCDSKKDHRQGQMAGTIDPG